MYNFLKRFLLSSIFVLASFSLIKTVHAIDPDQALADLQKTTLSTGPQGESPVSASEINLSFFFVPIVLNALDATFAFDPISFIYLSMCLFTLIFGKYCENISVFYCRNRFFF